MTGRVPVLLGADAPPVEVLYWAHLFAHKAVLGTGDRWQTK